MDREYASAYTHHQTLRTNIQSLFQPRFFFIVKGRIFLFSVLFSEHIKSNTHDEFLIDHLLFYS